MRLREKVMSVVEGLIIDVVDDDTVDVKVEMIGGDYSKEEVLRIKIGEAVLRPLGRQYTVDFLQEWYLGKRVHCIVRERGGGNQVEAIEFSLM
jgi:hypothetical protein